jgi:N-acetylglucosaminyldiphosphoundecaprenol N-acetyl-beta-D-mannosaminyltransferase
VNRRFRFLSVSLDPITMDDTVRRCVELVRSEQPAQHVVLNAAKCVLLQDQPDLRSIVERCDLINADGQSVVWGARFLGVPVPERVAGIDLMERLLGCAAAEGWPVYFLGARDEVLADFERIAIGRFPQLRVAGRRNGYFSIKDETVVADAVRASGARLLFVGISSPLKERFLGRQLPRMGPVLAVGVGGSFDVWAGRATRAPRWMQDAGLEWFHRLLQEPRRMWRRYLVGNTRFVALVLRERWRHGERPMREK